MDLPIEVIEAVKEVSFTSPKEPKKRAPYVKKLTKRILHAIGNGLRTSTSIANALNVPKAKIHSNLAHLKTRGLVYSHKQVGSNEHKYHLTTDKPVLDKLDLTKPKRKYTKRKSVYNKDGVNTTNSFNTPPKENINRVAELQKDIDRMMQRISNLEVTLTEKEKEVWTLECEVFDKKAIIAYLESKLLGKGVI
jgi:DNA-binding transcriptional MocR family regulator